MAYGVDGRNVSGGPDWASSTYFHVNAKSNSSVDAMLAKLTDKQGRKEKQHMLQLMLADRFQLKVHRVVREATVYDLVVAKNGTKMKPSAADGGSPGSEPAASPAAKPMMRTRCGPNGCEMTATSGPMPTIASMLVGQMAQPA